MFVQKAPAAKVSVIAQALLELYDSKSQILEIGIRHGEKKNETLVTSEEMVMITLQPKIKEFRLNMEETSMMVELMFL